jgi:hypothetical protein
MNNKTIKKKRKNEILSFVAKWMILEDIISEISHREKCCIPYLITGRL